MTCAAMTRAALFRAAVSLSAGLLMAITSFGLVAPATAQTPPRLDARSRLVVEGVRRSVRQAGAAFQQSQYKSSAEAIATAVRQIEVAMKTDSPEVYDALLPSMKRIQNARVLLELEGMTLPPFRIPPRPEPADDPPPGDGTMEASETTPGNPPAAAEDGAVSFVGDVAPILVQSCGRCHVQGSRGGFAMPNYAALMKGPPIGVVVFPGDPVASRLIEVIESGDMPRGGGRMPAEQLTTLKKWVSEGAKFDGESPDAPLMELAGDEAAPQRPERVEAGAPTGKETVDFARDIAPIFVDRCNGCHVDAMDARGDLDMSTLAQLLRGGDSGPPVQPGKGEESLLVKRLRGTEGNRMPAGGRPPLSDEEIRLVSTWIDEGAVLKPENDGQPLSLMAELAWLRQATPEEVTSRRNDIAKQHFALAAGSNDTMQSADGPHFTAWGSTVASQSLRVVVEEAEKALDEATTILPTGTISGDPKKLFNGKAAIYVLPRRYDYSEFARMVEGRSVPTDWQSHWRYNGLQAYAAVVATDRDTPEEIRNRLIAPVVSLTIASRGPGIPRWFADGLGRAVARRELSLDRQQRQEIEQEVRDAVGTLDSGKAFFEGKLPPQQADRLATAVCESLLDRQRKRGLITVMRQLEAGKSFDNAFAEGFNATPTAYFDAWLKFVKR